MQVLKQHIKEQTFSPVYLLYGQEDYLKLLYRDKLKNAMISPEDTMNYTYFEGKNIDPVQVQSMGSTVPFFQERRVIVIENSGWFKSKNDFADYLSQAPDTTNFIFVEQEVDKRNRLYKEVKKRGTICEMNGLTEQNLKMWVASYLQKSEKRITEQNVMYLIQKVGTDMNTLQQELEKLICYCMEETSITRNAIDEICVAQTEGKIFQMIDAVGMKDQNRALSLYYDLLEVREKPMSILFLIIRHFNILLQVKELVRAGAANGEIASKVGIPPFSVRKYTEQAKRFKSSEIRRNIERCAEVEQQVKTGLLLDQIGVELLIVEFVLK